MMLWRHQCALTPVTERGTKGEPIKKTAHSKSDISFMCYLWAVVICEWDTNAALQDQSDISESEGSAHIRSAF